MKVLIDDILSNEQAWIAQKVNSIGSGDIACIAGADRFRTPLNLWAIKTRRESPDAENDHMWWGKVMERPIAELCKRKLNLSIEYGNKLFGHDSISWATATPDYFARGVNYIDEFGNECVGDNSILECKNVSFRGRQYWVDDTPLAPRIQVMWQMGIAGFKQGVIAPLIGGDHETFEARYVKYDESIFNQLLQLADKFMWHVQKDVPPPPMSAADSKIVDKIFPVLEKRSVEVPISFEPELEELKRSAIERKELERKAREIEEKEKITKTRLRLAMGGASKAVCGAYNVSVAMVNCKEKITPPYSYARVTIKGGKEDATESED